MASVPNTNSSPDAPNTRPPRWLGSAARRGQTRIVESGGWTGSESEPDKSRWLGSAARRDPTRVVGSGWAEPDREDTPRWLGSTARRGDRAQATETAETNGADHHSRSLFLVDLDATPSSTPSDEPAVATPAGFEGSDDDALDRAVQMTGETGLSVSASRVGTEAEQPGHYVVGALGMPLRVAA
jgi:hypothetical protein